MAKAAHLVDMMFQKMAILVTVSLLWTLRLSAEITQSLVEPSVHQIFGNRQSKPQRDQDGRWRLIEGSIRPSHSHTDVNRIS